MGLGYYLFPNIGPRRSELKLLAESEEIVEERPYSFLSLDGNVERSAYEMVLPFWDLVEYEKISVIERSCRLCKKEDKFGVKSLEADGKRRLIKYVRYNPLKEGREIKKFEERELDEPIVEIEHKGGRREIVSEKPTSVPFWSMHAGLLYAAYNNSGYVLDDLQLELENSTNSECLDSTDKCLGELKEKGLIYVNRDRVRLTDDGFRTLANYLHKWWGLNGVWKSLYEEKLTADLLELAKYGFQQSHIVIKKSKADYQDSPLRRPKSEKPKSRREKVKIKTRRPKKLVFDESHVINLMKDMSGYSDGLLYWLTSDKNMSSSVNVKEAANRVLLARNYQVNTNDK